VPSTELPQTSVAGCGGAELVSRTMMRRFAVLSAEVEPRPEPVHATIAASNAAQAKSNLAAIKFSGDSSRVGVLPAYAERLKMKKSLVAIALAVTTIAPAWPVAATEPQRSKPVYTSSVVESSRVPMRDGETLFIMIERPVVPAGVKVPVILTFSPYNILNSPLPPDAQYSRDSFAEFFVPRGFARAFADVRGTRESSGCWDYGGTVERRDGYDLVEWLAARPWSNGKIGMVGGSYEGTTANSTAVERPPHLATIVPIASIDRWYDYAYMNGVRWLLNSEETTDEGVDTPLGFDFGFAAPPPVDVRAASWPDATADRYRMCDRDTHTLHGYDTQPDYDAFWIERDYRRGASAITIPTFVVHGLDDYNVKSTGGIEMYRRVKGPKRMVLGQWPHALGVTMADLHPWFDQWLLGLDAHALDGPQVRVQSSDQVWHAEKDWPPPNEDSRPLWLAAQGALTPAAPPPSTGTLLDDPTVDEDRMMREGTDPAVLRFAGEPAATPTRIAGEPLVTLDVAADRVGGHLATLLAEVAPDGTWKRISRGFLNLRYRNGLERGEDLTPGKSERVSFTLMPADHVVAPGNRVVLALTGSNVLWAVPDENRPVLTVGLGSSVVTLPVVRPVAAPPKPPTAAPRVLPRRLPGTGVGAPDAGFALMAVAFALAITGRRPRVNTRKH
jgi:X-Pro dipeptidyl-peptidase